MNDQPTRILLTLDCGNIDVDALRVLTLLSSSPGCEVTALYVEDVEVMNAARLPGMSEVSTSGTVSRLDPQSVRTQLARQADIARQEFESSARRLELNYSFQLTQGSAMDSLIEAAAPADIVVVHRSLRAAGLRTRRGAQFQTLIETQPNLLFVNEPWASGQSVVALCEAPGDQSEQALAAARRFARAEGLTLVIAVPPDVAATAESGPERRVMLRHWDEDAIVDLCAAVDARLLVVSRGKELDWRELLARLIDRVRCSLLRLE